MALLTGERAHYELAAGHDIGSLIRTYEKFATIGQMMPEQVWDEPNRPDLGLRLGQPGGSAVPLVWAHAEYLKLLRSALDGKVFDRVDPVYERYCEPEGRERLRRKLEIYTRRRPIQKVTAGDTLRILDEDRFKWCGPSMDGNRHTILQAGAWGAPDSARTSKSPRPRKPVNYHGLSNGPRRTAGLVTMCKSRSNLNSFPTSGTSRKD